jgi:hypothetical protein
MIKRGYFIFNFNNPNKIMAALQDFNEIDLNDAVELTANWRKTQKERGRANFVKSFRVSVKELEELIKQPKTEYVRFYFGLDENDFERLILVSVMTQDDDKIIQGEQQHGKDLYGKLNGIEYKVYDFSRPCPPICDPESVLDI